MKPAHTFSLSILLSMLPSTLASSNSTSPKRGLCYIATSHSQSDATIFTRPNSPLTWYYNYSPWPGPSTALTQWTTDFIPMIHSASEAAASIDTLHGVLNGSLNIPIAESSSGTGNHITHVLTFNEPDGDTSSGGTASSPSNAAQVWHDSITPLRSAPYNLKVSLPATTGSSQGLDWLRDFNTSCYKLNKTSGCAFDFVATHWYGDFAGLSSWLSQIHDLYPSSPVWVTEFAIPSVSANDTEGFLNQSLPFLDGLSYVERYAWFGSFRESDADGFTGEGVSVFDGHGDLTELGATWLGGERDGFEEGESASGNGNSAAVLGRSAWLVVLGFVLVIGQCFW